MRSSIIVQAFSLFGGDPQGAISAAASYSSTSMWVFSQASQAGIAGAVAISVPGAHIPALAVDLAFLMHKMAYCSWGLGALYNCEVEGKDDFALILGLWAGYVSEDALEGALTAGIIGVPVTTAVVAPKTFAKGVGKGVSKGVGLLGKKAGTKAAAKIFGKVGGKLSEKLALKLALKFSGKISSKAVAGWVPFVGPAVGLTINSYFVKSIAGSATRYYSMKAKL